MIKIKWVKYLLVIIALLSLSGCQYVRPEYLIDPGSEQTIEPGQTEATSQLPDPSSGAESEGDLLAGLYIRVDSWVGWNIVDVVDRQHYFFSLLPSNQVHFKDDFDTSLKILSISENGLEFETSSELVVIEDTPSEAIYGTKKRFVLQPGEFLGLETLSEDETYRFYFYLVSIHDPEVLKKTGYQLPIHSFD